MFDLSLIFTVIGGDVVDRDGLFPSNPFSGGDTPWIGPGTVGAAGLGRRRRSTDPRGRAIRRFLAIGRGYIQFAQEEPHLLASAFLPIEPPSARWPRTRTPWQVLAAALDELVVTGAMPVERRTRAEAIARSLDVERSG